MLTGGGYLPKILEAIVDAIPEAEPSIEVVGTTFENKTQQEAAELLGLDIADLEKLKTQLAIRCLGGVLTRTYVYPDGEWGVVFGGGGDATSVTGGYFSVVVIDGLYSAQYYER